MFHQMINTYCKNYGTLVIQANTPIMTYHAEHVHTYYTHYLECLLFSDKINHLMVRLESGHSMYHDCYNFDVIYRKLLDNKIFLNKCYWVWKLFYDQSVYWLPTEITKFMVVIMVNHFLMNDFLIANTEYALASNILK